MKWTWWPTRVETKLDELLRRTKKMGTDIQALDEAIQTLTSDVATLKTAVEALIAAIPPGDFTAEVDAVKAAFASVEATTKEATDATPPSSH